MYDANNGREVITIAVDPGINDEFIRMVHCYNYTQKRRNKVFLETDLF